MSRTSESLVPDLQLINIHQPDEAGAWSRSLGCSEEALRAAVQAVGHSAQAVRSYLSHRGDAGAGTGSAQASGDSAQRDRHADTGHYDQYGMRDDPRGVLTSHPENPGTGEGPRRFGGSGDESTYENRDPEAVRGGEPRGPQGPQGPIAQVSASGSARELGYDYGGERLEGQQLSSRQGAALIDEKRRP